MSKPLHPLALFRLSVLGPLASRGQIKRGEVKAIIRELASKTYNIPDSRRVHLSEEAPSPVQKRAENAVDLAYSEYNSLCAIPLTPTSDKEET